MDLQIPPPPIFHALWEQYAELDLTSVVYLITAISVHISLSPPNPPIKFDECCDEPKKTNTLFERFVQYITFCSKSMIWLAAFCEAYIRLSDRLLLNDPSLRSYAIHPCVAVGGGLTLVAAILRIWCFKSLGPFFTFEITIRPKHELITTGPYAWVRHPSYTGVYLTLIGATLVFAAPTTWISQHAVKTPLDMDFSDVSMDDIQTDSDKSLDSWKEMESVVIWKSSQSADPIINKLMTSVALEAQPQVASNSRAWQKSASLEMIPSFASPMQANTTTSFPLAPNIDSSSRPSSSRPQFRPRNSGDRVISRTSSEQTISALTDAVPSILDLMKGVSDTLNQSVGITTRSVAGPSSNRVARNRARERRPAERRGPAAYNGALRMPSIGRAINADGRLPSAAVKGKGRAVDVGNSMEGVEYLARAGPSSNGKRAAFAMDDNDSMINVDNDQRMQRPDISSEAITSFPRTSSQTQMPPPMELPRKHPPADQTSRNHDMAFAAHPPVLPPTQHKPVFGSVKAEDKSLRQSPIPKLHPLLQKPAPLTNQGISSSNSVSYLDKRVSNTNLSRGVANSRSSNNEISPPSSTPALSSTPSSRPPVLGMRRTHTLPLRGSATANQKGGFSTRPKAFKPPLLSSQASASNYSSQTNTLPRDSQHEKPRTFTPSPSSGSSNSSSLSGQTQSSSNSSGAISTPSTFPLPATQNSKSEIHSKKIPQDGFIVHPIPKTPPLPEPTDGDPDSSFGNMSFDLDALEETMKLYD
ncbi:hypothetical protein CVT24_000584 [Panaeolus cyanescens]|uniref:Protein-S-isoprenylcysteine O-methyltransferase n=1 Tax=Panaeolus cyanescens TaxID=181874 RepID=A0A409YDB4_9AGAR|nr:hypothetical protein CVT24_000584 [Panaeolus cyanescens]